jgi:SAM-dependent methyltransferase
MPAPLLRHNVFNEVADLYDAVRPGYPAAVIGAAIAGAALPAGGRILEIGCGTGQITLPFAELGFRILALEPGDALAALAARKCRAHPRVTVLETSFEAWSGDNQAFDLVVSAQAFHWIDPDYGCAKAASVLRPGGAIALIWTLDVSQDTDVWQATQPIYEAHFRPPAGEVPALPLGERVEACRDAIRRCEAFDALQEVRHAWTRTYSGADYLKLLNTFSDHRTLPEPDRTRFFHAVEGVIARFRVVERRYETLLLLARRT